MSNLPKYSDAVLIRLRPADREVITARATRANLTVSEYMRRAALGTLTAIGTPTGGTADEIEVAVGRMAPVRGNPAMSKFLSSAGGDDPA